MPDRRWPRGPRSGAFLLVLLLLAGLAPGASALDVSAKAIKVVGSAEYPNNVQSYTGLAPEFNGEGVAIAILDTGVDDGHPTFSGAYVASATIQQGCTSGAASCMQDRNPVTNQGINPDDTDGHGTHVASIALGRGCCGDGPRGVAAGARLVDVKIASDIAGLSLNGVASGIRWVIDYNEGKTHYGPPPFPVKVMSISYASNRPVDEKDRDDAMKAVQEAWEAGILVVAAAGNCGPSSGPTACPGTNKQNGNTITSPGAAPEAVTVGAMDDQTDAENPSSVNRNGDQIAGYSSRGPNPATDTGDTFWRKPDIVAPGSRIAAACASITPGDQQGGGMTCTKSGTSMATPHVAGVAAILFQAGRESATGGFTAAKVKDILLASAEDWNTPGWDASSGYGYVDGYAALIKAINLPPRANFVYRPAVPQAGQQVEFDASLTRDPDDADIIERFVWDFGDGSPQVEVAGEVKRVEHTYPNEGAYTVRLTATDSRGATDVDVQTVQVEPPPPPDKGQPPVPVITFWPKSPRAGDEVFFDAKNSTDPDGDRLRQFHWDFEYDGRDFKADVKRFDDTTASWTFETSGVHRVTLRVVDERGLSALRTLTIGVAPPPPGPPTVEITNPKDGDTIQAGPMLAAWVARDNPADSFTVFLDGIEELTVGARQVRLDLVPGEHTLRVVAVGPGGVGEANVSFLAVEGEALQTTSTNGCSTHTHGDGTREEHCPSTASSNRCELVTHRDGRTEQLCGSALDAHKRTTAAAKASANDEPADAPLPPFAVLLVALGAVAAARRRRA